MPRIICNFIVFLMIWGIGFGQASTNGLIAYYPFNDGSANDGSGNGRHGIVNGAVPSTDRYGNANACFQFDGIDDFIEIADHVSLRAQNISFNLWVNPAAVGDMMFLGKSVAADASNEQYGFRFGPNQLWFSVKQNSNCVASEGWSHNLSAFSYAPNEWIMVTATFSGKTSRIYANGHLIKEEIFESGGIDNCPGSPLRLGIWWGGTLPFNGKLDDARIYNRGLTAQEVTNIYNAEKPSTNLESGLVAYYPLDGNANDASGKGRNGTPIGVVPVADRFGVAGKSLQFDGNSWITVTDDPAFDFTQSLTFSMWLWFDRHNQPTGYRLVDKETPSVPDGYTFDTQGNGSGADLRFCPGPCEVNGVGTSNLPVQEWVQVAVAYNSGIVRLYVNGKLIHTGNVSSTIPVNDFPLTFGRAATNSESYPEYNFRGKMDDIRIYNRALDVADIEALYISERPPSDTRSGLIAYYPFTGNSNDESGNGNHASRSEVQLTTDRNGENFKAYHFNGSSSYISAPTSASLNSIDENSDATFAAWFNATNWNANGVFINKSGPDEMHYRFYSTQTGLVLQIGANYWATGYTAPSLNIWHHIAGVKRGNMVSFYLNGESLGTVSANNSGYTFNKGFPLEIGRDAHGPLEWSNGKLDEVRIYNRALTAVEVNRIYKEEFSSKGTNSTPRLTITYPIMNTTFSKQQKLRLAWEHILDESELIILRNLNSEAFSGAYRISMRKQGETEFVLKREIYVADVVVGNNPFVDDEGIELEETGTFEIELFDKFSGARVVSVPFEVVNGSASDFDIQFHWDRSWNQTLNTQPIGVAADSVSRIIVALKHSLPIGQSIKQIVFRIGADGYPVLPTDSVRLLGRVSVAKTTDVYSSEADNPSEGNSYAKETFTILANNLPSQRSFQFWYISPADYALQLDDYTSERFVKTFFDVTMQDDAVVTVEGPKIKVVRPPLVFVHGLGGDRNTWAQAKYFEGTQQVRFFDSRAWKVKRFFELDPAGGFKKNALQLIGTPLRADVQYRNSLPEAIKQMRLSLIASNRVDYVAHSMGGNMARSMIETGNQYINYDNANYSAGLINKLITVNTPHFGSPIANLVDNLVSYFNSYKVPTSKMDVAARFTAKALAMGYALISDGDYANALPGFLASSMTLDESGPVPKYKITDAIRDLRSESGYQHLSINVRNHTIGSQIFGTSIIAGLAENRILQMTLSELQSIAQYRGIAETIESIAKYVEFVSVLSGTPINLGSRNITSVAKILKDIQIAASVVQGLSWVLFLFESDGVVSNTSQHSTDNLASLLNITPNNQSLIPSTKTMILPGTTPDRFFDFNGFHTSVTDWSLTGDKIFALLNAPATSPFFANSLTSREGGRPRGGSTTLGTDVVLAHDSTVFDIDRSVFDIVVSDTTLPSDSALQFVVSYDPKKVGSKLIVAFGDYQNAVLVDSSGMQKFKIEPSQLVIGSMPLMAAMLADTAKPREGYFAYQNMTVVPSSPASEIVLDKAYVEALPRTNYAVNASLNVGESLVPWQYNNAAVTIENLSVVVYDSTNNTFVVSDTGTSFVYFRYGALADSVLFRVNVKRADSVLAIQDSCQGGAYRLYAQTQGLSYNWYGSATGNVFSLLTDTLNFNGINSPTLIVRNATSDLNSWRFRCDIAKADGSMMTENFRIQFRNEWIGTHSSNWHDTRNWKCGAVPSASDEVIIRAAVPFYPYILSNAACAKIYIESGANISVAKGVNVEVSKL